MKNIFTKILKTNQIITKNIEKYNVDWMNKFHGKAHIKIEFESIYLFK